MKIALSEHFTYKKLLRFVAPSIVMMVISSIYTIVDGFFVSNYVGKTQFAALNFIFPAIMILGALGFIVGTGGSALVAKTLGEGDREKAYRIFSMLIYVTVIGGVILSGLGILLVRPVAVLIGATPEILDHCVIYATVILAGNTAFMLQIVFQSFLVVAERPKMGLVISVASGVTNMILDWLLVGILRLGLVGAALATISGQAVGGIVPLVYFFSKKNRSPLRLGKFYFNPKDLTRTVTNGFSEFVTNISASVVGMVYNAQLLRYAGEDGVSAYGVLMYLGFIFLGFFFGYSMGSGPVISYHYGAGNKEELRGLFRKSLVIIGTAGVIMTGLSIALAKPLSMIFVSYDEALLVLTVHAMCLYAASFTLKGFNIFASSFFTALNNGVLSAVISVCRTFVADIAAVLLLPLLFGINGVWLAVTAAESVTLILSATLIVKNRKRYGYVKTNAE